jgi:hypothetical protein
MYGRGFPVTLRPLLSSSLAKAMVSGRSVQVSQGRRSGWAEAKAEVAAVKGDGSGRWDSSDNATGGRWPDTVAPGVEAGACGTGEEGCEVVRGPAPNMEPGPNRILREASRRPSK